MERGPERPPRVINTAFDRRATRRSAGRRAKPPAVGATYGRPGSNDVTELIAERPNGSTLLATKPAFCACADRRGLRIQSQDPVSQPDAVNDDGSVGIHRTG